MREPKTVIVSVHETLTRKGTAIAHCSCEDAAEKLAGLYRNLGNTVNVYSEKEYRKLVL